MLLFVPYLALGADNSEFENWEVALQHCDWSYVRLKLFFVLTVYTNIGMPYWGRKKTSEGLSRGTISKLCLMTCRQFIFFLPSTNNCSILGSGWHYTCTNGFLAARAAFPTLPSLVGGYVTALIPLFWCALQHVWLKRCLLSCRPPVLYSLWGFTSIDETSQRLF